jgi:hypothetical protein
MLGNGLVEDDLGCFRPTQDKYAGFQIEWQIPRNRRRADQPQVRPSRKDCSEPRVDVETEPCIRTAAIQCAWEFRKSVEQVTWGLPTPEPLYSG